MTMASGELPAPFRNNPTENQNRPACTDAGLELSGELIGKIGRLLGGSPQQDCVRGNSQGIADPHQRFQAGNGIAAFNMGEKIVGDLRLFCQTGLGHALAFPQLGDPFSDPIVVYCHLASPLLFRIVQDNGE